MNRIVVWCPTLSPWFYGDAVPDWSIANH